VLHRPGASADAPGRPNDVAGELLSAPAGCVRQQNAYAAIVEPSDFISRANAIAEGSKQQPSEVRACFRLALSLPNGIACFENHERKGVLVAVDASPLQSNGGIKRAGRL
jgi:hypothetical protein